MPRKTLLISGAGGFLGEELIYNLSGMPAIRTIALTSDPDAMMSRFPMMKNLECYGTKDELSYAKLPFEEVDVLIHCAFARTSEFSELADSLQFTYDLLNSALNGGVKAFINVSSQSVYGRNRDVPWVETSSLDLDSPYSFAKFSSELLTQAISAGKIHSTSVRLAALTGPGADGRFISVFVRNALEGKPIKVIGENQVFSFIDVHDAATGILSLINVDPARWQRVYNLGTHWRYTLLELAHMVKEIAKDYTTYPVCIDIEPGGDTRDARMNCNAFFTDTGWRPKRDPRTIIRSLFEHYVQENR